ncbi:MAG: glycoside hydrolase family 2 protein [Armatimonadaceae bacterium]
MPSNADDMEILRTILESGWEVAERLPPGRDLFQLQGGEKYWTPATVPGQVHLDLMKAGIMGDPFYRMYERSSQWVDLADWTYRTTFTVDAERLAACGEHGRHFLHFDGLDTLCRVFVNRVLVGEAENFFIHHRFDVTEVLREGENELRVEFDSALRVGRERAEAYLGDGTSDRGRMAYFNFAPRAFVRKPQYMFGWDWGSELVSCGIWQKVEWVTVPAAEILDWSYTYTFQSKNRVNLTFQVTVQKHAPDPVQLRAEFDFGPSPTISVPDEPGTHTLTYEVPDVDIVPWDVTNTGSSHSVHLQLQTGQADSPEHTEHGTQVLSRKSVCIAFRGVELIQEPDDDGKGAGFKFRLNGRDLYIKGANWIPDHAFPAAITRERLEARLRQAKDAGFNMLRVWGGGLYESEDFYNLCDELGILVWQDFAFACSMYPDDLPEFQENVRQEAIVAVKRIRNHPCLALWCGGNENLELFQGRWNGDAMATKFYGDTLIYQILPEVVAEHDPNTPYLPNSPYGDAGEGNCQNEDYGDSHYWNVWHSKKPDSTGDWTHYAESRSRFSSEFGFASPAGLTAWDSCMAAEDKTVGSLVSRWHDKTRKGYETYLGFIARHYPEPQTFEDLVYYGQCNQADALKFGVEHYRRMKGRCWGTLFWQLNDCWPTHSWAVIDFAGEPKAAYYAAKRFYAPLLVSLWHDRAQDTNRVDVHLVNDTFEDVPGTLELCLYPLDHQQFRCETAQVTAPANAAALVHTMTLPPAADGRTAFVHALFRDGSGEVRSENFLLLDEPKNLLLPDPQLSVVLSAKPEGSGEGMFTLTAGRFAAYVWLQVEGVERQPAFSDNFFHLAPGQSRTVQVSDIPVGMTREELQARLRIRHL